MLIPSRDKRVQNYSTSARTIKNIPIFQDYISGSIRNKNKGSSVCIALGPVTICIPSEKLDYYIFWGGLVAQAVRRSPPTAGVPNSRLGPSMWVSWWTKRGLGKFFTGFLPFSPTTNFIPPFLHTHLIHFVSFHQSLWWCVRRGRPEPLLFTDLQYRGFIASYPSTRPCVGHELRIFFINLYIISIEWHNIKF